MLMASSVARGLCSRPQLGMWDWKPSPVQEIMYPPLETCVLWVHWANHKGPDDQTVLIFQVVCFIGYYKAPIGTITKRCME